MTVDVQTAGPGKSQGRLYLVGVGPGDPELMTFKAAQVLRNAPVWIAPKARENGNSLALQIARNQVEVNGKDVLELCFPMKKIRLNEKQDPEVVWGWKQAADIVLAHLDRGLDVAFPTLGDPALYSTAFYLLNTLQESRPRIQVSIVPGITAMSACSAHACSPLGLGDDVVSIIPAAFDDERLREILTTFDAVVLMKVHRRMAKVIALLDELGLTDKAVLIERCGLEGQKIYTDIRQARDRDLHYFSTLLVRKKSLAGLS
ncbi:MAG: precorrin-2 C(20)-methyltransferase [Desulfobulbaceae bacterium]|nr:precorrin-2 C(20)-methyltransferase [Desulfobulbaceae bacterium]